ncbi:hypothetical protein D3C87_43780 [compost metagenome]
MHKLFAFLKYFIPFSVILFVAQFFITEKLFVGTIFFYQTWSIYAFHIIATLLIYLFLLFVNKNFFDKTGFAFLAGSVLKMMAAVVFLVPLIQSDVNDPIIDVAAFFIPYFLFLFFETIFAIRLINNR